MKKDRTLSTVDLSHAQQEHVRNALLLLKPKVGSWKVFARALKFEDTTLVHVAHGRRSVSVLLAFRLAKFVNVCVTTLLAGRYPNDHTCPRCGYANVRRVFGS